NSGTQELRNSATQELRNSGVWRQPCGRDRLLEKKVANRAGDAVLKSCQGARLGASVAMSAILRVAVQVASDAVDNYGAR
ncbi:MAG TPA: hypothetical protein DEF45_22465, partial [Rhodopirellula sp.]|nr:hypothetical protein [Rhodopirellula sp.]